MKVSMLRRYTTREKAIKSTIIYNVVHIFGTLLAIIIGAISAPMIFFFSSSANRICWVISFVGIIVLLSLFSLPYFWSYFLRKSTLGIYKNNIKWKRILRLSVVSLCWSVKKTEHYFCAYTLRSVMAVFLEIVARFVEGVTFYFIFLFLNRPLSWQQSVFLEVGRTLVDNILFFVPYQIGGREQGIALMLEHMLSVPKDGFLAASFWYRFVELSWVLVGYFFWLRSSRMSTCTRKFRPIN